MPASRSLCDLNKTPPPWISYPESLHLFTEIENAGGRCRFVGGCVRDALLGAETDDLDVCTDLEPEKVLKALVSAGIKAIPTGIKHGTVTALIGDRKYEITTLRRDIKTDGRHAVVSYTKSWQDDAARRDFTINALSMDLSGTLYDFFSGQEDLAAGCIRFIGDAGERIKEDRLRILRFFRFFSRYGKGRPDEKALAACNEAADQLDLLSAERISKELLRLLSDTAPLPSLKLMKETGVLQALFKQNITLEHLDGMLRLPLVTEPINRLGALLNGNQGWTENAAISLRLSSKAKDRLLRMCGASLPENLSVQGQKKKIYQAGQQTFKDRVLLCWAREPAKDDYLKYWTLADTWKIPVFPISGKDLLMRGVPAGPELGQQLKQMEQKWIESDFSLSKVDLLTGI